MATHDYDIANQSGANFRTDLNNCLDAIVSNNSNASDPSTTFAYMWWVDTSNNVLKLRNSANNAWITLPMSITASNTITPTLNMGTGAAEDVKIVFDGNAQDFYIALDDSEDDLLIGKGSTVGTTPAIAIDENLLTTLHGGLTMVGTTPTLTIGDGGEEDTKIVFDGNAQDFYIGLDDSADDLVIGTGSTVGTNPIVAIENGGSVGIGTASPDSHLHLESSGATTFRIRTTSSSSEPQMIMIDGAGDYFAMQKADRAMTFKPQGSEGMRVDSSGHLLVGTTTEYTGTPANITAARQIDIGANDANLKTLFFHRNAAEGEIGGIAAGISNFSTMGRINFVAEGVAGGSQSSSIRLKTTLNASEREVSRFDSSGNFLVGKTGTTFSDTGVQLSGNGRSFITSSGDECLSLNRKGSAGLVLRFFDDESLVGSISTNANSLPSDRNFKKNIDDLDLGLNLVTKLKPSQFRYKHDEDDLPVMYGLVAQDLEESLTEVGIEKNSTWLLQHEPNDDEKQSDYSVDYLKLIPILINSIKELEERIKTLEE